MKSCSFKARLVLELEGSTWIHAYNDATFPDYPFAHNHILNNWNILTCLDNTRFHIDTKYKGFNNQSTLLTSIHRRNNELIVFEQYANMAGGDPISGAIYSLNECCAINWKFQDDIKGIKCLVSFDEGNFVAISTYTDVEARLNYVYLNFIDEHGMLVCKVQLEGRRYCKPLKLSNNRIAILYDDKISVFNMDGLIEWTHEFSSGSNYTKLYRYKDNLICSSYDYSKNDDVMITSCGSVSVMPGLLCGGRAFIDEENGVIYTIQGYKNLIAYSIYDKQIIKCVELSNKLEAKILVLGNHILLFSNTNIYVYDTDFSLIQTRRVKGEIFCYNYVANKFLEIVTTNLRRWDSGKDDKEFIRVYDLEIDD